MTQRIAEIAGGLTKAERRCILTWGHPDLASRAPVPDSIWHGKMSHLKMVKPGSGTDFVLSEIGLAVRNHLMENAHD